MNLARISHTLFLFACATVSFGLSSCGSKAPEPEIDYYRVRTRQFGPAPVYSRLVWSQLPQPLPNKPGEKAPMLSPSVSFELGRSTLQESLEAISQTFGYRAEYPDAVKERPVALKMVGTLDQILQELGKQTHVYFECDHQGRMIRVVEGNTVPELPGAGEARY